MEDKPNLRRETLFINQKMCICWTLFTGVCHSRPKKECLQLNNTCTS